MWNEASPQQAAGYQTEGHCRGDTTVSPPSSLCKVTSQQAPRNLLNEASPQQAAGYQTEGHCRGDTTVSPPSSLCKVTSQQAPRNLLIEHLARLTRRYDVHTLRRLPATRRHALLLCFLVEVHKTLLDYLVAMHDQLLTTKCREARHVHEERLRTLRRRGPRGPPSPLCSGSRWMPRPCSD